MPNEFDYKAQNRFAEQFMQRWLDQDYRPIRAEIENHGWGALPVADFINVMEAEWLSEAILELGCSQVTGISFEYQLPPLVESVEVARDSLLRFISGASDKYVCITNLEESFLFYKEQANRFFLLCGPIAFVRHSYRCSEDSAKAMYYDFWIESSVFTEPEKKFMEKIWLDYAGDGQGV